MSSEQAVALYHAEVAAAAKRPPRADTIRIVAQSFGDAAIRRPLNWLGAYLVLPAPQSP